MARGSKNSPNGKGILTAVGVIILMNVLGEAPELLAILIPLAIPVLLVYFGLRAAKKAKAQQSSEAETAYRAKKPDDCPKRVCRHDDKGEHHVARGREIDPWDRPDIDISKYQRK